MNTEKENQFSVLSYIPSRILKVLASDTEKHQFRRIDLMRGGVLFFDLVGFTNLATSLGAAGSGAAETLQKILTQIFSDVVAIVHRYGGDVYQFAGDAFISGFEKLASETDTETSLRTAGCAQAIQLHLSTASEIRTGDHSYTTHAKVAVCYGDFHQVLLGQPGNYYAPVIIGNPVEAASEAEKWAAPNEILMSENIWKFLPDECQAVLKGKYYVLKSIPEPVSVPNFLNPADGIRIDGNLLRYCAKFMEPLLYKKIISGYHGFIGEFRDVTSIFLRFDGIDYASDVSKAVHDLNEFYTFIQDTSKTFGGVLLQVDLTDKGNVFLILFGAPVALEQKELLSCRFAMKIAQERSRFSFINCLNMGISTGSVYCGDVGASFRKNYSVLGEVINLASRLMTYDVQSGIRIDQNTARRIDHAFEMKKIDYAEMKGIDTPLTFYEIRGEKESSNEQPTRAGDFFVGRKAEIEQLKEILKKVSAGEGRICSIVGEPGIGKSRLVSAAISELVNFRIEPYVVHCYIYEKFTPLYPWREFFSAFFKIYETDNYETKIEKIKRELIQLRDVDIEWSHVLAQFIGYSTEEHELARQIDPRQKQERIFQIINNLLVRKTQSTPILLCFEDAHWMDDLSMSLIDYLSGKIHNIPVGIFLVMRPGDIPSSISAHEHYENIRVKELDSVSLSEYLKLILPLDRPNPEFENLLLSRSHGNPFFLESIIQNLKEKSLIVPTSNGTHTLDEKIGHMDIPNSLQDVILSRIDKLPQDGQVILKTASVIGRQFQFSTICDLLFPHNCEHLRKAVETLASLDFTPIESESPLTLIFKHTIIRDVAYNSLLNATRQDLHLRLAQILEKQSSADLSLVSDILAYHYLSGQDNENALKFNLMAARKAKNQYARKDALHYFETAIQILLKEEFVDRVDVLHDIKEEMAEVHLLAGNYDLALTLFHECVQYHKNKERRAKLHIGIGQAFQEKGEPVRAVRELELALRLLGRRAPKTSLGTVIAILKQVLIRLLYSNIPLLFPVVTGKRHERYQKQAKVVETLGKIYFWVDIVKVAWSSLLHVNLSDRMNIDEEKVTGYLNYALLLAGMGYFKIAKSNFDRSLVIAKKTNKPLHIAAALNRSANLHMFLNEPDEWAKKEQDAAVIYNQYGDIWELAVTIGAEATSYYYGSNFVKCKEKSLELKKLAEENNMKMYLGWVNALVPFVNYIMQEESLEQVLADLERGMQYSIEARDIANQSAIWMHRSCIAVREGNPDLAAMNSVETYKTVDSYKIVIPHIQMAYVAAAEAAIFALENGSKSVSSKILHKIAVKGYKKGLKFGNKFSYFVGPALRIKARYTALLKGAREAEPIFLKALDVLENSPNIWERGVAYYDAAVALPHRREEFMQRAELNFRQTGSKSELARIEKFRKNH